MTSAAERVRTAEPVRSHARFGPWPAWAFTLAALVLAGLDGVRGTTPERVHLGLVAIWAMSAALMAKRRPHEPAGLLIAIGSAVAAASTFSSPTLVRPVALGMLPGIAMAIVVGLPDGALNRSRWTAVAIFAAAGGVTGAILSTDLPAPVWPTLALAAAGVPFTMGWAWSRYTRARGLERRRMQWFGWAAAAGATIAAVAGALRLLVSWPHDLALVIGVSTIWIPFALVAATSHRFVARIDRLLGHTVAVGGLVGLVAVVYVVVVLGLGRVPTEDERALLALSMAAAAVAALLFPPTRARLNELAARVVYGEQHAPDEVLRTFGDRLTRAVPMDELLLQAAESLRKTFGYDAVEVWTGQAGSLERTVSLPERGRARMTIGAKELPVLARAGVSGPAWLKVWLPGLLAGREEGMVRVAPIVNQGEVLGMIVVERREGETFTEEEERVLTDLARTVGVALHNVQLDSALQQTLDEVRRQAEDLRLSRQRIVQSADEARRKLERDVHDGAQQNVVALAVKARLIKTLLDSDPATARGMLDELGGDIQEAVQQLRDLAHGIFPKLLVDRGLEPALQSIAAKAALPTTIAADDIARYPSDVEAAVYFCCLEALQNAGKHAGEGASATISVREQEGALLFEIADDGAGFDVTDKGLGHGFVNMKDRVGAAGGTIAVTSAPGTGTRIQGRIPLG